MRERQSSFDKCSVSVSIRLLTAALSLIFCTFTGKRETPLAMGDQRPRGRAEGRGTSPLQRPRGHLQRRGVPSAATRCPVRAGPGSLPQPVVHPHPWTSCSWSLGLRLRPRLKHRVSWSLGTGLGLNDAASFPGPPACTRVVRLPGLPDHVANPCDRCPRTRPRVHLHTRAGTHMRVHMRTRAATHPVGSASLEKPD